ncbi:MAG: helix-turn-helix domain-containing protein [Salibacteraceae bacterium]
MYTSPSSAQLFYHVRQQRQETLRAFAQSFGVPRSTLHRWETGQHRPRQAVLQRLVALSSYTTFDELWAGVFPT